MTPRSAPRSAAPDSRCPLAGERIVDSVESKWSGLRLLVKRFGEKGLLRDHVWREGLISIVTRGHADFEVDSPTLRFSGRLYPGSLIAIPSGYQGNLLKWTGGHEQTIVVLSPSRLRALPSLSKGKGGIFLAPRFGFMDGEAEGLIATMRMEIESDCPSGNIFAESVSLALAARLASDDLGARSGGARIKGALTPEQRERVVRYVASRLSTDLSLTELSGVIEVSPGHFARMFRKTFGLPPYRYIIEQRVDEAKRLIADGRQSILEIALSLGFSSQSHFTVTFRKVTGKTPRQFHAKL